MLQTDMIQAGFSSPETTTSAFDELGHFCGVAGVRSRDPVDAHKYLFYMLFALQHRGQESAGIAWEDSGAHRADRYMGMVSSAMDRWLSGRVASKCAIGHVRYSTSGGSGLKNAQPITVECTKGRIALGHNGNISNGHDVRAELFSQGSIFQTSSDSELILHLLSKSAKSGLENVLRDALSRLEGAYSLCMMWDDKLVALRDPRGFRPLYIASLDGAWFVASETCALNSIGCGECREVAPGECIVVDDSGPRSFFLEAAPSLSHCVFESIYFARPDSYVFGESVIMARKRYGAAIARVDDVEADIVVPVPDSGTLAALGYSGESGIRFDFGFTRNHYAGRSFILPSKSERELAVRMKLHAVPEIVAGKRVVLIDDSLVRGTTSRIIARMLKEAGASEIHLRLSSPELKWPCYYGIDIPTREELISNRMTPAQIAQWIGADSVRFLPIDVLKSCLSRPNDYCCACFDGLYPCPLRGGESSCRDGAKA